MIRVLSAMVLTLVACGTDPLPAGAVCSQSSDCDTGLSCLDVAQFSGASCTVIGKACSTTCNVDADCTHLGANFKCFAGCGTDKTCGATGP